MEIATATQLAVLNGNPPLPFDEEDEEMTKQETETILREIAAMRQDQGRILDKLSQPVVAVSPAPVATVSQRNWTTIAQFALSFVLAFITIMTLSRNDASSTEKEKSDIRERLSNLENYVEVQKTSTNQNNEVKKFIQEEIVPRLPKKKPVSFVLPPPVFADRPLMNLQ